MLILYPATLNSLMNIVSLLMVFWGFFWPSHMTWGILVSWSGMEPRLTAMKVLNVNHCTAREFPILLIKKKFFFFWPHHMARGILVYWAGIESVSPALGMSSLNHWTTRKSHSLLFFVFNFLWIHSSHFSSFLVLL